MVVGVIEVQTILLEKKWEKWTENWWTKWLLDQDLQIIDFRKWQLEPHGYKLALLAI